MQLSIKTPPELTLPVLEKCAVLAERIPSHFVADCVWQCLKAMDLPHLPFHSLDKVSKYYYASGREHEILPRSSKKPDPLIQRLTDQDRAKRAKEAARRLTEFRAELKKQPPSKHLHLKISQGMDDLPQRIKEKATWLRLSPNALVMACLRDCLAAMDDAGKAIVPPPIVVDFWTVSHAKLRPKAANVSERMMMDSYEKILRERNVPILDTVIRFALAEKWDTSLEQILRDAGVLPKR
jgi:hypothetical protein